jgi:hypothetical protein
MKKITLSALILAGIGTIDSFGQGTVTFANIGVGTAISNIMTLAPVPSGTAFRASLYYLPDQATAPTTADFDERGVVLLPNATTFPLAGQFNAGTRSTPGGPSAAGAPAYFQVRAWETAFGTSYEQAANAGPMQGRLALIGTSNIIRVNTGNPLVVPPVPPGTLLSGGLKGFYVAPVPEPSVIGLGALGIGALLLLRRRK